MAPLLPRNQLTHVALLATISLALTSACIDTKIWTDDTGSPPTNLPVSDTYQAGYDCSANWVSLWSDPVDDAYIFGTTVSPGETPGDVLLSFPCDTGAWNPDAIINPSTPADTWRADFISDGAGYMCESTEAAGTWKVYLPEPASSDCADYGELTLKFDYFPPSPPPPPSEGGEDSTSGSCSSGSARFKLYKYFTSDKNHDDAGVIQRFAVKQSGDSFPERAWIREIDVVSWGSASKLVFGKVHHWLEFSGTDTLSTTNAVTVTSSNSNPTFASGVLTMGTFIAEDGFDLSNGTGTAPVVDITWSCEVPSPAHYSVLSLPTAYGDQLSDLAIDGLTSPHLLKAYLDTSALKLRVGLQGRFWDAWEVPVTSAGGGVYEFDHQFTVNNIHVAGSVSTTANTMTVDFDTFTVGGVSLGTPTWYLPAL